VAFFAIYYLSEVFLTLFGCLSFTDAFLLVRDFSKQGFFADFVFFHKFRRREAIKLRVNRAAKMRWKVGAQRPIARLISLKKTGASTQTGA
jgi:hypothetical protein